MFIYVSLLCLFMYVYVYSKYEWIFSYLQIRSNLPKRNVMKNFLRRSNNNLQARGYFKETSPLLAVIQRRTLSNIYDGDFLRKAVIYF